CLLTPPGSHTSACPTSSQKTKSLNRHEHQNPKKMADRAPRATNTKEKAHATQQQTHPGPPGAALNAHQDKLQVHKPQQPSRPQEPLRQQLPAARLPLHVQPKLKRKLPRL